MLVKHKKVGGGKRVRIARCDLIIPSKVIKCNTSVLVGPRIRKYTDEITLRGPIGYKILIGYEEADLVLRSHAHANSR